MSSLEPFRFLHTGDLHDVSLLNLLMLVRGHGSLETLFSIEGGSQESLVDGGAGAGGGAVDALPSDDRAARRDVKSNSGAGSSSAACAASTGSSSAQFTA